MTLNQTAANYSALINVDVGKQLTPVIGIIEDMLTRLEEFESLVAMAQDISEKTVGDSSILSNLCKFNENLEVIGIRTDALETLVGHVRENLNDLEIRIQNAEIELHVESPNKFKTFLKPFKKIIPDVRTSIKKLPTESSFKADDYFSKESN